VVGGDDCAAAPKWVGGDRDCDRSSHGSDTGRDRCRDIDNGVERRAGGDMIAVAAGVRVLVPYFDSRRNRIIAFAAQSRLPAIYQFREYAVAAGLISYGPSLTEGHRQYGIYAGRILKGWRRPSPQRLSFENRVIRQGTQPPNSRQAACRRRRGD
jgi:hypothetical protein